MYELLAGEPWCWPREVVNAQTDFYLWEVVIRPAVRKSREFQRKHGGGNGRVGHGWEHGKKTLPSRAAYIAIGERLGVPKEVSEREWDKFQASRRNGHGSNA